jgi:RNA polymerase sigma-70 factor (ECF subfamily)
MRDFERLYNAHGAALLAYLRRGFGRCAAPEDMLQETFVQAMRRPQRLAAAQSPRAWLFGIARHIGLTAARRHRPAQPLDANQHADQAVPQIADLRELIATLPPALRETLELRLRERLSYEEIAQVLGIPMGTVRSRLHAAMQQLRRDMNEE